MSAYDQLYLTNNDSAFKRLSDGQIEEILELFYKYGYLYDPYNQVFLNPLLDIAYKTNKILRFDLKSIDDLLLETSIKSFTSGQELPYDKVCATIISLRERYHKQYKLIRKLRYVGLVIGTAVSLLYNLDFGIFLGLYFIYLDYNYFDYENTLIEKYQGSFSTARIWHKNKILYFLGTLILNLIALFFLYRFTNSYWIPVAVLLVTKFFFEYYTFKVLGALFWATSGVAELDEYIRYKQTQSENQEH